MKIFKKTKKAELTANELVNIKLNKEKLARAGFGYYKDLGFHEMILNKTVLVPSDWLKVDWADLKKEILRNSEYDPSMKEAMKQRLEV